MISTRSVELVIDTVVCLTLAKWETVSGQFGGYLRGHVNPISPRFCYDEGKRYAETLFFDCHRQHKLRIKVARIFNTYGPRMHSNDGRVVSNFIVQSLRNRHHRLRRRHADAFVTISSQV